LLIPPKMIIFSNDSPSVITVIAWFPILQSFLDVGIYLIWIQAFWSRRNMCISSKNGVFSYLHISSFLPPTTMRA